jgi:DNA-directed RNA polymerase subunit RPC12/RpoP
VNTYYNEPGKKTGLANVVHLQKEEAPRQERNAEKENRDHCRRIAEEVEAYANGQVYRCPECDEILHLPDDVGDKYRCPHCGEVSDLDDLEQLSVWDYLADCLDVEYRCGSYREYRSVQIMVAWGGPNIYLDTASKAVELYWWNESARYLLSDEAAEALDQWAEDYWNM